MTRRRTSCTSTISRVAPRPHFTESAVVRGVAFDREGQAQASMGIAVDDPNGDGLLDIFVTNFYREFNVLYEQMPGGFFTDVSRERGLAEPSYLLLTFGTQFMDMDLDGYPDLITTNGHVDDFRAEGAALSHASPRVSQRRGPVRGSLRELRTVLPGRVSRPQSGHARLEPRRPRRTGSFPISIRRPPCWRIRPSRAAISWGSRSSARRPSGMRSAPPAG